MSERTRNGKAPAQDALGFLFSLVGGFFAVSIVLFLSGQQPKPGLVSALTSPVIELVTLLGPAAALLFSCGLAALGTLLFLRSTHFAATRPLLALFSTSFGFALIFGVAFGGESVVGGWLPGLVPGFVGGMLALVLGVALAWLGWTLAVGERGSRSSSADLLPRVGLTPRHEASGVSPAEAALLVSDPRPPLTRPAPRREPAVSMRDETIRPFPPPVAPAGAPRATRVAAPSRTARPVVEALQAEPSRVTEPVRNVLEPVSGASETSLPVLTPPAPSWEGVPEDVQEQEEESAQRLSEALSEQFETEEASASADEDLADDDEEEDEEALADEEAEPVVPHASWEQTGLFDEEEEELEEEAPPVKPAKLELTPPFDFEASEPKKPAHEPEPLAEEPFVLIPAPRVLPEAAAVEAKDEEKAADQDEGADEKEQQGVAHERTQHGPSGPAAHATPTPATQEILLKPAPAPAPRPQPSGTADEGEGWSKLVYDAGCAILEQKRVAVSMLERRFGIDFDQACRVLDELQQAGLIGPYMGGRTRDILLTREQWLPHAPHAS